MSDHDLGFIKVERKNPGYRKRELRVKDWRAVERRFTSEELHGQAARCMDCGTPFCHGYGCPLGNVIPEFNELAWQGRWSEAWEILSSTDPMAEFTSLVCPAPCEGSCVAGYNGDPVAIRQIEREVVERAFQKGLIRANKPSVRRKEMVAVIGSGPAGLSAAWHLNRKGFQVTVYESAPKPGGILRYGIPNFKLEKWIVDRRIELMKEEGVNFEVNTEIGRDLSARYLHNRFDAVVLAGGARGPKDLEVPGRDLDGVHFAMPFLTQQNMRCDNENIPEHEAIFAGGKNVVVVGGGDTGSDCIGTSLRQGAKNVYQFGILPKPSKERSVTNPWPEWPLIYRESSSHQEGGKFVWSVMTKRLEGSEGKVQRIHACEVEWVIDESGRRFPCEIPGTDFSVETDLVLIAIGFTGPGKNLYVDELSLKKDSRGFVCFDKNSMTSKPGVFIAGDMAHGASLVVRALADGAHVARQVSEYLK
ncbi:Glutamate synthase [NADPH] small chain [Chitinispirillum alkaliphilum]|nr:Glutamate synthase [NADPH] small chain [Chitinispirillum alkaliphilum]